MLAAILCPGIIAAQTVYVSIPPQAFLVEQLAEDLVQVEVLLPPGASPATYEPTPRQMAALERSQLYLQIGAPFEGPLLAKISDLMPDLHVVDCRIGIELETIGEGGHTHESGSLDPHIWLDPQRMKIVATTTAMALRGLQPDEASIIDRRLAELLASMDASHRRVAELLATFEGRTILVFHPAFGYFTRRYGLHQSAVEVDGKAPTARGLARVVSDLGDHRARALFIQPQFSRTSAERVADALGCELVELDPLAGDYLVNLELMGERIAEALK
jgi:zinc transport system substrate-binding protein